VVVALKKKEVVVALAMQLKPTLKAALQ